MFSSTNMGMSHIQWYPPANTFGALLGYRLSFGRKDAAPPTVLEFPEGETHFTTKDIHKGAAYVLRLSARNRAGFGEEAVKEVSTPEEAPSGYPQNVAAEAPSATAARVSWEPPALAERNGAIVKYAVQYEDADAPGAPSELLVPSPESAATLDDLKPDTAYRVKMRAFTSQGSGPYSPPVRFRTQPLDQGRIPPPFQPPQD